MTPPAVRLAGPGEAARLAAVHLAALPGDVLPRLGRAFLERTFYPLILAHAGVDCLVAEAEGRVAGLLVLAWNSGQLTAAVGARRTAVALALARRVLRDPLLAVDVAFTALGTRAGLSAPAAGLAAAPEIYVLAVAPGAQGQGLGAALVKAALARLGRRDPAPRLVAVKTGTEAARRFYEKHGFRLVGREGRGRVRPFVLVRDLDVSRSGPDGA